MAAQTITAKFEKMLLDVGKDHDFTCVTAGFNSHCSVRNWWTVSVHWKGHSRDGISCAHGSGNSIPAALKNALTEAETKRVPFDANAKNERIERLRAELSELTAEAA